VRQLREYGEEQRYRSVEAGFNSRLDTLQAAFLLRVLPRLDAWNARRREIAGFYRERLAGLALPADHPGHVWHTFVVRVPDRDAFRTRLAQRGVETLVHYPLPVHGHPGYAHLARPGLEQAERAAREVVSLPIHPELTDTEAETVVDAINAL
jgi:dTDP-4-amino-4,6-dideoxygalactose transaminase